MFFQFLIGISLAVLVLGIWRIFWKYILKVFEELFMVYHVMSGGKGAYRVSDLQSQKVYPFVVKPEMIDEVAMNDIYQLFVDYAGVDKSISYYHRAALKYSHIILYRDRVTGSLRGTMFLDLKKKKDIMLINLGFVIMNQKYSGQMYLYLVPAYYIIKELILHPLTPVYPVTMALSYKGYLMAIKTWEDIYPRYDRKTPEHIQKVLDDYAESFVGPNEVYNKETGIIERETFAFDKHVATITDKDRQNPHIKFFEEKNPGWVKGDLLVMCAKMTPKMLFKATMRSVSKKKDKTKEPPTKKVSFVEDSSGKYEVPAYEMDAFGGCRRRMSNPLYVAPKSLVHKETVSDMFASVDLEGTVDS